MTQDMPAATMVWAIPQKLVESKLLYTCYPADPINGTFLWPIKS